jgi:hypothetical protein
MSRLATLALLLVAAGLAVPEIALAQGTGPGAANVWTFSTDSSNNLVVQDLASLNAAGVAAGEAVCIQWIATCPTDVPKPRRRYLLRNVRDRNGEWRIEIGNATFSDTGMALPLEVGVGDTAMVQVVSSEGPWTVDLRRVPAVELRAGDGKKWKLSLNLSSGATSEGCWVEVQCPGGGE